LLDHGGDLRLKRQVVHAADQDDVAEAAGGDVHGDVLVAGGARRWLRTFDGPAKPARSWMREAA
jgi:hypothetical protein